MSSVPPVDTTGPSGPAHQDPDNAQVEKAFQEGIANYMLSFVQSAESDVTESINDNTSDPDAA
jgi:hypothetical protein